MRCYNTIMDRGVTLDMVTSETSSSAQGVRTDRAGTLATFHLGSMLTDFGQQLLATIYASLGLISWVLLQNKDSFRDFCLLNEPELTAEQCVSRWNRQWAVLLAVALCFIYHITIGFSVYRFTQKSTNPA